MIYENERTSLISFPLGGVGSGCVGLAGNGRLIDWEIFNRANKGSLNGMSHLAVKAERDGELVDARVLHGDLQPPYTGNYTDIPRHMDMGFGFGPRRATLAGMPHFRKHVFNGEYPFAWVDFEDPAFPGKAQLCGWSPFIPGNDKDSSLPVACFEVTLENTTDAALDYTVAFTLTNPFKGEAKRNVRETGAGRAHLRLFSNGAPEDFAYGELALSTSDEGDLSGQTYWYRGLWSDDLEVYWRDFCRPGRFNERDYTDGWARDDAGVLARHFRLGPGQRRTVCFVLSWHVPNCRNDWTEGMDELAAQEGLTNRWRNWYSTQWADAAASGVYSLDNYTRLREETLRFHDGLFGSTLPTEVIEGVSANLSILKSPTCLRLEDGTFYGWEGVDSRAGSCEGSCTHVWGYAQALPFLFPALERSMRAAHYRHSVDTAGGSHFRLQLPLGMPPNPRARPCVDGQLGDIMKAWRDWKISGDTAWVREHWGAIRKTLEYAWSPNNPDLWDPEKSGVITGRQHHTLDMELYGPSAWLNGHYLGALKAAADLAEAVGETAFAQECREIFARGKAWTDEHLFNGEYYGQRIDLEDRALLERFCADGDDTVLRAYWSQEHEQIKYQIGTGCATDMHLPQWYASLYGLGEVLDPDKTLGTLRAAFTHNFKTMREVTNPWRHYALNDERGLLICTWPEDKGPRPVIPVPYNSETFHGVEWAAACHLIMLGLEEEGLAIVRAIRERYDGLRRNPWNEFECGSNYARSLASYALVNAYVGLRFDATRAMIGFAPRGEDAEDCQGFWCLGTAWGVYARSGGRHGLCVEYGELPLEELQLAFTPVCVTCGEQTVDFSPMAGGIRLRERLVLGAGDELVLSGE
jgi:uncharacterized protein (DUF608 family)